MSLELGDFREGDRIEVAPHTDTWMFGDRFGEVLAVGRLNVKIKLDSGRTQTFRPEHIGKILYRKGEWGDTARTR